MYTLILYVFLDLMSIMVNDMHYYMKVTKFYYLFLYEHLCLKIMTVWGSYMNIFLNQSVTYNLTGELLWLQ